MCFCVNVHLCVCLPLYVCACFCTCVSASVCVFYTPVRLIPADLIVPVFYQGCCCDTLITVCI